MYENSKAQIVCPSCGKIADLLWDSKYYCCNSCGWNSNKKTADISYSDAKTCSLSNLFPHKFDIFTVAENRKDVVHCLSMESLLQSFKIGNPIHQKLFCESYSGYTAYKMRLSLPDWRINQILYWNGKAYNRNSDEYLGLLTAAYDRLFYGNDIFREIVLPEFKEYYLIHSIGKSDTKETVLTEGEYRYQLNRLIKML